jgi:hypothetical protein
MDKQIERRYLKTGKYATHLSDTADLHLQSCTNPSSRTPNWLILEATKEHNNLTLTNWSFALQLFLF